MELDFIGQSLFFLLMSLRFASSEKWCIFKLCYGALWFHYWWFCTEFCYWESFWTNQKLHFWWCNGLVWKEEYHDWECQRLSAGLWRQHGQSSHCQEHFLSFLLNGFIEAYESMISWIIIIIMISITWLVE